MALQHLRSSVAGRKPTAGELVPGQLFINLVDRLLFALNSANEVVQLNLPAVPTTDPGAQYVLKDGDWEELVLNYLTAVQSITGASVISLVNSTTDGVVTLKGVKAGTNVTLSEAGGVITINSTGGGSAGVATLNTLTGAVAIAGAATNPNISVTVDGQNVRLEVTGIDDGEIE